MLTLDNEWMIDWCVVFSSSGKKKRRARQNIVAIAPYFSATTFGGTSPAKKSNTFAATISDI